MKKLIVPAILVVVMVIGISFTVMPLERVQTLYSPIRNFQLNEAGALSAEQFSENLNTDNITVTSTEDFVASCIIINDTSAAAPIAVTISFGAASATFDATKKEPFTIHYALNKGDTLTVSSADPPDSPDAPDGLCTAMTTTAGTIIFG